VTQEAPSVEAADPANTWQGGYRPYDLVKEFVIALVVVGMLTVLLAGIFSSPDRTAITIAQWSRNDPTDFATTAVSELDGSSTTATYGPPYTHTAGAGQKIGPVSLQRLAGVQIAIDPPHDFVLGPVATLAPDQPPLTRALQTYEAASSSQQQHWTTQYAKALTHAHFRDGKLLVSPADDGAVPTLIDSLLAYARGGGLDGALVTHSQFYATDYTKPLLFMSDSTYLQGLAQQERLLGGQWGMMNETGNYPGQAWLWLYTFWYQISPFKTSTNADALIWTIMAILTLALVFVPFIPGVRALPRRIPVYRLIWRDYYRSIEHSRDGAAPKVPIS
jgi:hypothetical protein